MLPSQRIDKLTGTLKLVSGSRIKENSGTVTGDDDPIMESSADVVFQLSRFEMINELTIVSLL